MKIVPSKTPKSTAKGNEERKFAKLILNGVLLLTHHVAIQPGKGGRQLPEQLLEPEIAHQDAQQRQAGAAAFAQRDRRSHSSFPRAGGCRAFRLVRRRRNTHTISAPIWNMLSIALAHTHEQVHASLRLWVVQYY